MPRWLSRLGIPLDFSSDHDFLVHGMKIRLCADSTETARDSLFPSLSLPLLCAVFLPLSLSLSLFLKINK